MRTFESRVRWPSGWLHEHARDDISHKKYDEFR